MDWDILRALDQADYETAAPLYAYLLLRDGRDPDDWEASHLTDAL